MNVAMQVDVVGLTEAQVTAAAHEVCQAFFGDDDYRVTISVAVGDTLDVSTPVGPQALVTRYTAQVRGTR